VGAANPAGIAAFDDVTGTHSTIAADYLPANAGWSGMDGEGGSLSWMFAQAWTGTAYTLSLGVPIIPTDPAGRPQGTLASGAAGAYDAHFTTLAETLVAAGESNAYLRLGWEFDGGWNAWKATTPSSERNFAAYFRHIVAAMSTVPGAHFRFVWNPDADAFNSTGYNVALAYPGNAYVNDIGIDIYDQSWVAPLTPADAWTETTLPSLTAAEAFANRRDKPVAVTEWGTAIRSDGHGLGDDPLYVTDMIAWIRDPAHHVAFELYFDYEGRGTDSTITGGRFPRSLAAFKLAFSGSGVERAGGPTTVERSPGHPDLEWLFIGAFVVASGLGMRWRRRVGRLRNGPGRDARVPPPRRVYPPEAQDAPPPVRQWAQQRQ
jgi:hypothetical protein